jgi:hypothetical protein
MSSRPSWTPKQDPISKQRQKKKHKQKNQTKPNQRALVSFASLDMPVCITIATSIPE